MDKRKRGFRGGIPLLIVEIVVLLLSIGMMYAVIVMTREVNHKTIDREQIHVNEEIVKQEPTENKKPKAEKKEEKKGCRNIALFGVDARDGELGKGTRSDTIMIASIDQDTQEIKLISVFRDTYLNLGNDSYNKCNTAYARGGPEQAINMLNRNLDLAITDYVTIGFSGLIDAVNALGGVEIEVTDAEISHLNNYQLCMAEELNVDYIPVDKSGRQTLNGMQATAYCRIRYTKGDDFRRAERQRQVLAAMMDKARSASIRELTNLVNAVLPQVETSLDANEILSVLGSVAGYRVTASDGFPFAGGRAGANVGSKGSCVIPMDLEENVLQLHQILYPAEDYAPSSEVRRISGEIKEQTSEYLQ
ncbi:MAG: LCP family protein [Bacteroidales bacterium]|nr:LCP family protein [Bacteroidales bacterium]MCM1416828.1 LCP family protein [bacterium]MCM1422409.1 LCP family protein [bacterium]